MTRWQPDVDDAEEIHERLGDQIAAESSAGPATGHIYDGGRCRFCNVNDLDNDLYGPFQCADREPFVYTSQANDTPVDGDLPSEWLTPMGQALDRAIRAGFAQREKVYQALVKTLTPKPAPPFNQNTVVEIAVPSGRLIVSDDLRRTPFFDVEPTGDVNTGAGLDAWAHQFADLQVAYGFVGNSSPHVTRQVDGSLLVVELGWDEERSMAGEDPFVSRPDEVVIARVETNLWAVMMTDYEHWLRNSRSAVDPADTGGDYTLIDVTPGIYRWTVYTHNAGFDRFATGRVEHARLELVTPLPASATSTPKGI